MFFDLQTAPAFSAAANAVAAIASVITAGLAFLVFREARRIRQLEWINNTNLVWNDFNKLLLDDNIRSLWNDFLYADNDSYKEFRLENKINWIVFCYLNILVTSIHARKLRGRKEVFFKEILESEFRLLWKRRQYITGLMETTGYDLEMRKFFEEYCRQVDGLIQCGDKPESAFDKMKNVDWLD